MFIRPTLSNAVRQTGDDANAVSGDQARHEGLDGLPEIDSLCSLNRRRPTQSVYRDEISGRPHLRPITRCSDEDMYYALNRDRILLLSAILQQQWRRQDLRRVGGGRLGGGNLLSHRLLSPFPPPFPFMHFSLPSFKRPKNSVKWVCTVV